MGFFFFLFVIHFYMYTHVCKCKDDAMEWTLYILLCVDVYIPFSSLLLKPLETPIEIFQFEI